MKKHLFGVALFTCLVAMGGIASAQTIDEIQVYDASGAPASPYAGQIVTVEGVIIERGQYSSGSHYLLDDTGAGISIYLSPSTVALGDRVTCTGTVATYSGEIQLSTPSFGWISGGNDYNNAEVMTVSQVLSDYENVARLVSVIGTVTDKNASNFWFTDGADTLQVYIDSTTGINLGAVDIGDVYQVVSPVTNYNTTIELKPRFQSDLVENPEGDTLPIISGVNCANWVPMAADPITVNATITDDGAITSAMLYYRNSDGEGTVGSWTSVPMSNAGSVYSGVIPASHPMRLVEFYVQATDDGAQTVNFPGDAPVGFKTVAVGITPIWEMQYADPDSNNQDCAYNGKFLNIRGVVTAGSGQVGAPSKFIVQEQNPNPATGDYAFSGVLVYESSAMFEYYQGDLVEIGGSGDDYFGLSEMIPHNGLAVNLLDFGQDLPAASRVPTRILADDRHVDGTGALGEAWESVWVKTFPSAVMDTIGYGDYTIADKGADSLIVSPIVELTYVPTIGDVITIESYMSYDYGNFTIVPISDEFIVQTGLTPANDTPTIVKAGGFKAIAPNPFNPATKISFVVNKDNLVQLNVYNLRGEKVRTLVQDRLPQNEYEMTWDGKNDAGQSVASGNYFARLRIGAEVTQVRKMSLVK